jgi:hypothetical protein
MRTLAQSFYLDSCFGVEQELPRAGNALENPYVYDASARELKALAAQGSVEITFEHHVRAGDDRLIDRLRFKRLH